MGKTRIGNLAKELKIEVGELIQRLHDELGLKEKITYLSLLDEETVARARQTITTAEPQLFPLAVSVSEKILPSRM